MNNDDEIKREIKKGNQNMDLFFGFILLLIFLVFVLPYLVQAIN